MIPANTVRQGVNERASAAFIVEGMDCADEIRQIEDKLGRLPGVDGLQFVMRVRNGKTPTTGGRESPVTYAATWPSARLGRYESNMISDGGALFVVAGVRGMEQ